MHKRRAIQGGPNSHVCTDRNHRPCVVRGREPLDVQADRLEGENQETYVMR